MRIRRAKHVAWRAVADEMVVLNLATKQIYGLNATGAGLWDALAEERSFDDLEGERDLLVRQLDELRGAGLVEIEDDLPAAVRSGESVFAWQEKLERAVGQCGLVSGQTDLCNQYPGGS